MNKSFKQVILSAAIMCSTSLFALSFENSYSTEVKFENGGSSGEVELVHPKVRGSEIKSGAAVLHSFLNLRALSSNRIEALSYICMNEKVILFTNKSQKMSESMSIRSVFSTGAAARNVFPHAFGWLAALSGMNGEEPSSLACRRDFLESVSSYRLENLRDVKFGKFLISQKKPFFSKKVKTIITW